MPINWGDTAPGGGGALLAGGMPVATGAGLSGAKRTRTAEDGKGAPVQLTGDMTRALVELTLINSAKIRTL